MGQLSGDAHARRTTMHRRRPSTWPFKAPVDDPAVTEFGVGVPRRQEVEFADGSKIWLHRVELQAGLADLFLRDLGTPAEGVRIDLRRLVPSASTELPATATRDVPGWVHFALRGRFKSVAALLEEAITLGRPA